MNGTEKIIISDDDIIIPNVKGIKHVMHRGETSLMCKLAEIVTKNGGDILEIGFGMHLSADAIQSNSNVTSHTIIEVHPEIYQNALIWAKDKPNTKILLGDWIELLPISEMKYDGVLHDTHLDPNISKFLEYIKPNCKQGTIVGFFEPPIKDSRLNAIRHTLTEVEFKSLPYKNEHFKYGDYELQYTIFNGVDFEKDKIVKSLI
jgi:spermidine synthase